MPTTAKASDLARAERGSPLAGIGLQAELIVGGHAHQACEPKPRMFTILSSE